MKEEKGKAQEGNLLKLIPQNIKWLLQSWTWRGWAEREILGFETNAMKLVGSPQITALEKWVGDGAWNSSFSWGGKCLAITSPCRIFWVPWKWGGGGGEEAEWFFFPVFPFERGLPYFLQIEWSALAFLLPDLPGPSQALEPDVLIT